MKVMIGTRTGRPRGWANAMEAGGFPCTTWDEASRPAFDAFDEVRPGLYIALDGFPPAAMRCLAGLPNTVAIDASGVSPAFDPFAFRPGTPRPDLACDVAYWGSYDEGIAERFLVPLCDSGLRVKVFGRGPWPFAQHLGYISDGTIPDLVASASTCLEFTEDFSCGDRFYTINGLGGISVSVHPSWDHTELIYIVGKYLNHYTVEESASMRLRQRESMLFGHTYSHRAAAALRRVGLLREADRVMEGLPCM